MDFWIFDIMDPPARGNAFPQDFDFMIFFQIERCRKIVPAAFKL
jgi:hypothetical protein